jgi:hypothetical protein
MTTLLLGAGKNSNITPSKTVLLMHMDNNYLDACGSTVTGTGNFGAGKFGNSVYFSTGQIASMTTVSSKLTTMTEGTIESWIYKTGTITWGSVINQGTASGNFAGFDFSTGSGFDMAIVTYNGSTQTTIPLVAKGYIPNNQWVHVAAVWKNNTWTGFVNGVKQSSGTNSYWPFINRQINIGNMTYATSWPFLGNIDELRISNVARYTANFTPPTSAFTLD